ncbi:MAG: hypothetical protein C5B50_10640 [Verrucomicrobia bacterium]|nr:MAG: hypothetical protein C5B50_10640 [Verrucomicrobiota bacterium]
MNLTLRSLRSLLLVPTTTTLLFPFSAAMAQTIVNNSACDITASVQWINITPCFAVPGAAGTEEFPVPGSDEYYTTNVAAGQSLDLFQAYKGAS